MSAQPVDVLAVMDDAAEKYTERGTFSKAKAMREARAAVAELVEADKEYDAARAAYEACAYVGECHHKRTLKKAEERRRAALARVQGGAA